MRATWFCFAVALGSCAVDADPALEIDAPSGDDAKADGSMSSYPLLEFKFTAGHDHLDCRSVPFGQIPAAWNAAVDANAPHFQALWNTRGEPLLRAASQILGPRFFSTTDRSGRKAAIRNVQATFTVCPGAPGMGVPLILQMSSYIDLTASGQPFIHKSDEWLTYTLHEILHPFLDDKAAALRYTGAQAPIQPTPSLQYWSKWLDDNAVALPPTIIKPVVLQHLHLLAVMKAIFTRVGRPDLTIRARTFDSTHDTTGSMGTAWAIVDLAGATDVLVSEIRSRSQ